MDIQRFIKENIAWFIILVVAIVGLLYWVATSLIQFNDNRNMLSEQKETLATQQQKLEQIKAAIARQEEQDKKATKSGKVIYEVLGQQFGAEASFGIMLENVIANITNSGLRIRSIDYNYHPSDDDIINAGVPGYNACELRFKSVGTYSQLQSFLKSIVKENYLTSIHDIYIEPYDKDKTILIATFGIRLYTKTIQ